jgi:hypothetical protein
MVQLINQFRWLHRAGFGMLRILADHAGVKMAGQKFNSERIERRPYGRDLVQDIDAIPIVFDHPLDPGDLSGNPIGSAPDALARIDLHPSYIYPVYV